MRSRTRAHARVPSGSRACRTGSSAIAARKRGARAQERPDDSSFACFSAEFGLDESLPIYSGGLGVLAGDHLKAAFFKNVIGLYYRRGYFRQRLDAHDRQVEHRR